MKRTARDKIALTWGDDAPDWVRVLADECDRSSQTKAAGRIGYSGPVINTVLARTYKGSYQAIEQAVKGALMNAKVWCPVAGELAAHQCSEYQRAPFTPTNPIRVRMFRACRAGCPHSRHTRRESDDADQ
ncbi:hypothetical protein BN2364_1079 [Alloalcanivorax xenomutans]|uniref:hypothetical protein n=1 Tax=Alloalcanivorax xenomutans TaxID=1094342 RepID=UPI0006D5BDE5|nr:hypothetical protein [Alloalcanivorax xenomutans]CUR45520.1 hypothetical protein BN2364_1079 [Alloalcanivorax xenomutans]